MERQLSLLSRFNIYQKERFPIIGHGLMIIAFTFSAVSYSRICRGYSGFISLTDFLIGVFASFTLFLLVRIFDEFKDQEEDAKYRSYLPVPRGLISLSELKKIGWVVAILQVTVIGFFQTKMLLLYVIVLAYLLLMAAEFFAPQWLKKRQILYITSHMMIIPLIDLYSSGLDWLLVSGGGLHLGVVWFMAVSFTNGLVLEFGRKIRVPEKEEEGVVTYSKLYGTRRSAVVWMVLLTVTMILAGGASLFAGYELWSLIVFAIFYMICAIPALSFISTPTVKNSKRIEYASALWTALMYLSLGAIPMLNKILL